jgi:predicted patatin/cPLA2 family phospholipase
VQTVDGHHDGSDRYDPVVALLRSRRESGSKPGARGTGDHARLALLVEGGGMRGVVSAAMMCALDDGGFKDAFDDVYATSAGAMNAAYFLAGETWFPLSIYYDDLATRKFVDFLRPLRGKPVMSLDYAFDEVVRHRKPLDVDAILHSPTAFHVTLTLLDPARSCAVSDFRSGSDLIDTLRASCWLPIATSGTATWRGVRAVDGGVLAPTLEGLARERGVTHVLSLQTRGAGEPRANRVGRWYVRRRLDSSSPGSATPTRRPSPRPAGRSRSVGRHLTTDSPCCPCRTGRWLATRSVRTGCSLPRGPPTGSCTPSSRAARPAR